MAFSSLLLFGPVSQPPTKERLVELQQSLREDPNLKFLTDEIRTLPYLLPHLQEALPEVDPITGADELSTLHVLTGSPSPRTTWTRNIVLAPLTIISQIVDFWHSRRGEAEHTSFPGTDNVQGFCLGFLTATALATSRSPSDFRRSASIALRLAVCIRSIIDLRESPFHNYTFTVRWKPDLGKEAFEAILKDCSSVRLHILSSSPFEPSRALYSARRHSALNCLRLQCSRHACLERDYFCAAFKPATPVSTGRTDRAIHFSLLAQIMHGC